MLVCTGASCVLSRLPATLSFPPTGALAWPSRQSARLSFRTCIQSNEKSKKNANGARFFSSEEFLTSRQIASFFSRVSKKNVVPDKLDTQEDAEIEQDAAEALRERTLEEACSNVHSTLSIKHAILYDVYNLCKLTAQNEMGRFSKQMLKEICSAFDPDPSHISNKRSKQPHTVLLTDLVHSCSCFKTS